MVRAREFLVLDGIRGVAALFVMIRHTSNMWGYLPYRSYLAVDLFFVLSGFVIAHAYDRKLADKRMSWREFMVLRLIRIYPMYVLSLLVCACIVFYNAESSPNDFRLETVTFFFSLFLLPVHFLPGTELFPFNYVYWSLFFELWVNGMYAVWRPRMIPWLTVAGLLGVFIALGCLAQRWGNFDMGSDWDIHSVLGGSARAIFGVFLGVMLYLFRAPLMLRLRLRASYLLVMSIVAVSLASPSIGRGDWVIDAILVLIVFPLCILLAAQGEVRRGAMVLSLLGTASYPVYLFHRPAARIIRVLFHDMGARHAPISGLIFAALMFTLALIGERLYDQPLRRWLKARYSANY